MDYLTQLSKEVKLVVSATLWLAEQYGREYGMTPERFQSNKRAFLNWCLDGMVESENELIELVDAIMSLDRQTRG